MSDVCPCCSGQPYETCCAPYHRRESIAPTAEALMRSRYCAYALGEVDYLMHTTHRENPEYKKNIQSWRKHLAAYCQVTQCHRLEILDHQPGEKTAYVTFRAIITQGDGPIVLTEKSRFMKMGQRWLYHSGDAKWDSNPDPTTLPTGLVFPQGVPTP